MSGQVGRQDLVVGVKARPQRGEVGMGGADAMQQQEGFARSGAIPGKSKRHRDHGMRADDGRTDLGARVTVSLLPPAS